MTIGQVNIILVLKGLPKWQRKWEKASEKWKSDWVLSDVDWEELRDRARPELDEALSIGDNVFFARVKEGLQDLQPLADDAKDTSEFKLIKYLEEYVKKYTLVWGDDEPQSEQADPEPQREKPKSTRGKGRPKGSFKDRLVDDADGKKLERLHQVMKGKMGKDAALIMMAAMGRGWINKPTYQEVKDEFGDIGSRQGFSNYFDKEGKYTEKELEGAKNSL